MRRQRWLAALAVCLAWCGMSSAAVIATIENATVAPGSSGIVNVFIRSSTGTDALNSFGFEFLITTGGPTQLGFTPTQPSAYLNDPSYVFFGDSLDFILALPVGNVSAVGTNYPFDTYIGGDNTFSGSDVILPTTDRLLAQLQVTTATGIPPNIGDLFTISFVPTNDPAPAGPSGNTFFTNAAATFLPFSSTSGVVAIDIPEPSTLSLLGLSGGLWVLWQRRRARRAAY